MATNIQLYTLSTCPYCEKAKEYFAARGIAFDYTDYDLTDRATQARIQAEMEGVGAAGFPFARIGGETVEGFEPERYTQLLQAATP